MDDPECFPPITLPENNAGAYSSNIPRVLLIVKGDFHSISDLW